MTGGAMEPGSRRRRQARAKPLLRRGLPQALVNSAITERRREDVTPAQYGAWMAERRECPACTSSNVAVDGERFGGLWCLDCRHEWRGTKFPGGADPDWWTLRG